MQNGYSGVLSLSSVSFNTFEQTTGTIDQPTATTNLVVTSSFTWTGGTLNSTSNLATVTITGSGTTGTIDPDGGTVILGSSINLEDGAVATMKEGTINVINDGTEFKVWANSGLAVDPGVGNELVVAASPGQDVRTKIWILQATAWVEVRSGVFDAGGWVQNDGGEYRLKENTSAYHIPPNQDPYAYDQSAGALLLWNNTKLLAKADSSVRIAGGKLITVGENSATTQAVIQVGGYLLVTGGEILLGRYAIDPYDHVEYGFGALKVEGEVDWRGGTYRPYVPGEHDEAQGDLWWSTGTFWVGWGTNPTPALAPVAYSDENNEMSPPSGRSLRVIKSDDEINAPFDLPSYDADTWQLIPYGDETKDWEWWVMAK